LTFDETKTFFEINTNCYNNKGV